MIDAYLREKIMVHVAAILEAYELGTGDIWSATDEIIEAIENEITWANGGNHTP